MALAACALSSCSRHQYPEGAVPGSRKSKKERAAAYSQILGFKVTQKDDLKFYGEVVSWLGTPYVYGGNSRAGVDCSGLVRAVYRNVYNVSTHRTVQTIYERNVLSVSKRSAREGDLVFFKAPGEKSLSHVGIFLKDGYFVHASTSRGVVIDNVSQPYYKTRWKKTGRMK